MVEPTSRAAQIRTVVGLVIGAAALIAGVAWAALGAAQNARQGIRVRFATIDTAAAEQGSAFLIVSSRDVVVTPRSAAGAPPQCASARQVKATGRITRGTVRTVALELVASGTGTVSIEQPSPCGPARVSLTLDDGTVLAASRGTLQVTSFERGTAGRIAGTFSVTAMRAGSPLTITGTFELRVPAARPPRVQAVTATIS